VSKKKATDAEIIAAIKEHNGSRTRAAESLDMSIRRLFDRLAKLKARGAEIPEAETTVMATSTLRDAEGNLVLQWTKANYEKRSPIQWAESVKEVFAATPIPSRIKAPDHTMKDLMTVYPIGDHHTAMYAWAEEAGADYDIKLADRLLVAAAEYLVDISPPSETALIVNVGDFFHVDQHRPETTRSHNALDVDTRYAEMIRAGVKMMRAVIESALRKHKKVIVVNACGNHDDVGALWLSLTLGMLYEKNPRVTVDQMASKFTYHQHGKVLIGVTHGDTAKLDKLAGIMAADQPELWGQTEHRYWLTGHIHQRKVIEQPGCMVESFRTLAARDAWATAAGYRSGRDMTSLVLHKRHGEVARHRFDVGMLEMND
jgi:hypothetical protein